MTSTSSSASTTPMLLTPDSTGGIALASSGSSNGGPPPSPSREGLPLGKKSRRQATLYDHTGSPKPVKPFSRSAAKRESVLALGSIEHLQQYFKKTGMVNKKNPLFDKKHMGLVPAIGGMPLSPTENETSDQENPSIESLALSEFPPEPPTPSSRPLPTIVAPHIKTSEAHPDTLLPGVISELSELVKIWAIDEPERTSHTVDILPLLKNTTRAIHAVRNYVLSLPDDSTTTVKVEFKRATFSSQLTGSSSSASVSQRTKNDRSDPLSFIRKSSLEVLGCLRDLEERARIPLSDEAYDAQSDGGGSRGIPSRGVSPSPAMAPPVDLPGEELDAQRAQYYGDLGITFSLVQVHGRYEQVAVWEDEDADLSDEESVKGKRELWHETLEVANGWLYRRDIKFNDFPKERAMVQHYLDAVDDALFPAEGGETKKERGWEIERKKLQIRTSRFASLTSGSARSRSKPRRVSSGEALNRSSQAALLLMDSGGARRRISTGMLNVTGVQSRFTAEPQEMGGIEEEDISEGEEDEESDHELDDDDLPDWAMRSTFEGDELGRAYAFLSKHVPPQHQNSLVPPSLSVQPPNTVYGSELSRAAFLSSLSSGQLLCLAYNICVRKSRHPWGFVSREGIHDIASLEKAAAAEGRSASNKTGWTFRRTDNLRLWIGSLKLRYMLPIQMPAQLVSALPPSLLNIPSLVSAASSRSQNRSPAGPPHSPRRIVSNTFPVTISQSKSTGASAAASPSATVPGSKALPDALLFDAQAVARKDAGWEDMLEKVLLRWMWKAINEKRKAVPTPIG